MLSRNIVFTGKDQVEFVKEPVRNPGSREVMLKARKTLISTGTEGISLSRLFEPGSHWDRWVKYPFYPGYLMVGEVVAVGPDVDQIHEGDRFGVRRPHGEFVTVATGDLYVVPDGIADEDAPWFGLATIVQNGVRRAEHTLGEVVVVIGLGLLGQLAVQYTRLLGARQIIAVDVSKPRLEMLFYTYVLRGDMRVTDLITHRYSPADAPEAYRMLREERATAMGAALFDWTQL